MTALNPVMTVGDQIAESLQLHQALELRQARRGAVDAMHRVGIDEPERRARSYPHQLSGGQRQRAMIAMALACNPKLLIADEPTTALDATIRLQILELLDRLRAEGGMSLLLITHDLNIVRRFAERVAVMEHGVIVEQGATADVMAQPRHSYTQKLVNSRPERAVGPPGEGRLVTARGVHVEYPTPLPGVRGWFVSGHFTAVARADFDLAPGETLGVIGESGSGKTTLALALLNLVTAQGDIRIDGVSWQESRRRGAARAPTRNSGRVPGSAVVAVAAADHRLDRGRRPRDSRTQTRHRGTTAARHRSVARRGSSLMAVRRRRCSIAIRTSFPAVSVSASRSHAR